MPAKTDNKKGRRDKDVSPLAGLEDRIHRATKLIGELRESNYSLSGELAALKREVEGLRAAPPALPMASPPVSTPEAATPQAATDVAPLQEELARLHEERHIIRDKVQKLLDRLEKLDRLDGLES